MKNKLSASNCMTSLTAVKVIQNKTSLIISDAFIFSDAGYICGGATVRVSEKDFYVFQV